MESPTWSCPIHALNRRARSAVRRPVRRRKGAAIPPIAVIVGLIAAVALLGGMRAVLPELIPDPGPASSVGATAPADTATMPAGEPTAGATGPTDASTVDPSSPTGGPTAGTDGPASQPSSPADILAALAILDTIPADPAASSGLPYDRDAFGQRWADTDHNGCDTRNDVLRRDLHDAVTKPGTRECVVLTGVLEDVYTGERIEFRRGQGTSELVQIDHIVPLAWAWRQGADGWTPERRLKLANDPANLQAVAGAANQSKSASGPARWLPPDAGYHCTYAARFTQVVADYGLALPTDDRAAVREVLHRCS